MELIAVAIIAAVVFGLCFLVDKGFTRIFRGQQQHHSGTAVRLNKRYGSIGLIVAVLGVACLFAAPSQGVLLWVAGPILVLGGAALVAWYLSFGVFYDAEAFLVTNLFKKARRYTYDQIKAQQLYTASGNVIEAGYAAIGAVDAASGKATVLLGNGEHGTVCFAGTAPKSGAVYGYELHDNNVYVFIEKTGNFGNEGSIIHIHLYIRAIRPECVYTISDSVFHWFRDKF